MTTCSAWTEARLRAAQDRGTRCLAVRRIMRQHTSHELWGVYPGGERYVIAGGDVLPLADYVARHGEGEWAWFRPHSPLPADGPVYFVRYFDPETEEPQRCGSKHNCARSADIVEPRPLCLGHGGRMIERNLEERLSRSSGRDSDVGRPPATAPESPGHAPETCECGHGFTDHVLGSESNQGCEVCACDLSRGVAESRAAAAEEAALDIPSKKLRRFSHSAISEYLTCPRRFYFRYVEDLPARASGALVKGTACDRAWSYDLQQKIASGVDLPEDELLERTEQSFRDDVKERGGKAEVDWGNDEGPRRALDSALAMSRQWLARLAPKIRPEAVQVERHVTLPSGRDFIGYYDWMGQFDGRVAIGDNKTARRRMSQEQADKNLQPTAYAYLAGAPITFVFARAIDTGASSYSEAVVTTRSAEEIAWYGDLALEVEKAMVANVYPVNPSSNLCSKSYCTYWGVCPVGRARTVHAT